MSELERNLREGESILWTGKPENVTALSETYKPSFIVRIIVCAVICAVVEVLYVLAANAAGAEIMPGVVLVIVICCVLSPILTLTRVRKIRKMNYAATDRRLVIVSDQLMDMEYGRIRECVFRRDPDGNTSLLCGQRAVKSKPAQWRDIVVFGTAGDDGISPCEKFAFYAVDDPEGLREVLSDKVNILQEAGAESAR